MEFADCFPIWDRLTERQRQRLTASAAERQVPKGTVLHRGSLDCIGLLAVRAGRLRAYILSEEGREITIYRLLEGDICLFSAACVLRSVQFEISVEAERDSAVWVVPPDVFREVTEESAAAAGFVSELMASRFSEVVWLMEQIMWRSFDQRLAEFLLAESALEGSAELSITHERLANHLGTAREVVTRMLRYFQSEGLVELSRGRVRLTDEGGLARLCRR